MIGKFFLLTSFTFIFFVHYLCYVLTLRTMFGLSVGGVVYNFDVL